MMRLAGLHIPYDLHWYRLPLWSASNLTLFFLTFVPTIFLSTWVLSISKSRPALPGTGHEPPVAPYCIPYLQHLVAFLWNPNKTFRSNRQRYPNTPFTLMMMNTKFHIFDSLSTVSYVFSKSREFVFEPVIASMMENGLNLPVADRPKFQMPVGPRHTLSKEEQESKEFVSVNHSIYIKYLTGDLLDKIMLVYMDNFYMVLKNTIDTTSNKWITVDFHEMMRKIIFETSAMTFFGTRLKEFWPNMWEDWKLFNDATFAGVRANSSFYFQPRALMARKRMLRAFDKWVDCDVETWPSSEGVWNEKWGVRMNWEREILGRKSGFSLRGRACLQASFLFVIVTNAAPMATWFTVAVLSSTERLERFRREALNMLLPQDGRPGDDLRFNISGLKANPFIQGVWKEALRLGSASAAARVVVKDTELEGYVVKKGSVILLPVQLMHFKPDAFTDPERFDPERWTLMSGNHANAEQQKMQNGNLRPFGGGTGLCSGRFVAEQEIITTVSTILLMFDIVVEDPSSFKFNPRSLGIMGPAKMLRVRLKKRKVTLAPAS